jgi:two-component system, chemotaxis family, sensor kinase CheA
LLPLLYLDRELKIEKKTRSEAAAEDGVNNMVVLQADGRQFGLIVDEIRDTEEIVVKPLDRRLKGLKTFAGATIMGDGMVSLILDVMGLAQRASIISETHVRAAAGATSEDKEVRIQKQTFLVFAGPDDARMAVPLGALARLEVFPAAQVEKSGTESVIQYRGKILPLVFLKAVMQERRYDARHLQALQAEAEETADAIQVLVCNHQGHAVGLVVERIVDIIEDRADVKSAATRSGVLYAAIIQERVTEILNLEVILGSAPIPQQQEEEQVNVGD